MALGDIGGANSFDSYEGVRVLIPGVLWLALGLAAYSTVSPGQGELKADTLPVISAALGLGLFLYYLDIPAKSIAYSTSQPTDYLEKEFPDLSKGVVVTKYLGILNEEMPVNTRNRSLYIGSMFRIGFEGILGAALAVSVVLCAAALNYGDQKSDFLLGWLGRFGPILWLIGVIVMGVLGNWGYDRKVRRRDQSLREAQSGNPGREATRLSPEAKEGLKQVWRLRLGWAQLAFAAVQLSGICLQNQNLTIGSYLIVGGSAAAFFNWVHSYTLGLKQKGTGTETGIVRNEVVSPSASAMIFALPILVNMWGASLLEHSVLYRGSAYLGWLFVLTIALTLMMVRGHERKLLGVYRGQTRWLRDNRSKLDSLMYGSTSDSSGGAAAADKETPVTPEGSPKGSTG